MREVAAEFRNPVLLYSIGKDSSVLLHIALKAFAPAKPPFRLLHIDTLWKFREMIASRDETAKRLEMELITRAELFDAMQFMKKDSRFRGWSDWTLGENDAHDASGIERSSNLACLPLGL
jgi:3'-phosphoadenosine 5'-phosphosulfate sulfotransferase (PAPS reductase)/FAD synthetase